MEKKKTFKITAQNKISNESMFYNQYKGQKKRREGKKKPFQNLHTG